MSILNYTNELFANLERDLNLVDLNDGNRLIQLETAFMMVDKTVEKMKIYLDRYNFQDQEEEVLYFKNYMPKLLSKTIFYSELFNIESHRPRGKGKMVKSFYEKEQKSVMVFMHENHSLLNYLEMNKSHFDRVYFLRNAQAPILKPNLFWHTLDTRYCTVFSLQIARIQGMLKVDEYLDEEIRLMGKIESEQAVIRKIKLRWTGPKVNLVELIYALKFAGVFNNGQASLNEISQTFEILFGKELNKYYRTFQEIRQRKGERMVFMNLCKERLEEYMEGQEGLS